MNSKNIIFNWDENTGIASCLITDNKDNTFFGISKCHPEDRDMMNEYTGYNIAYNRALLKALRFHRDNELLLRYKTLKQFYYTINHSQQFNKNSYETKMLKRQIQLAQDDLNSIKELINETKTELLNYIHDKDKFYNKIRDLRKVKSFEEEHNNSQIFTET